VSGIAERVGRLSIERRELLQRLLEERQVEVPRRATIARRGASGPAPLSFAQQRLWFLDQLEPSRPTYNIPIAVRFQERLHIGTLERSLIEVVRRHEALRTVFAEMDGEPVQVIQPAAAYRLALVDLSGLKEERREAEVLELSQTEARRPFDLSRGPLLRAGVLRLSAQEHVVLATIHHIVSDGWSMEILRRELKALYGAFSQGLPSPLPELPVQYSDYAIWQRARLRGEGLEAHLAHWRQRLDGVPALLDLPTDYPRPPVQSFRGEELNMPLAPELMESLARLGRECNATLFMTLLTAFQILLSRLTGQTDFCIGTSAAGRDFLELEGLIGFFVNTLVIRADVSGEPTFVDLLGRVWQMMVQAEAHQELPFERLVEELRLERSLAHSPLVQVLFGVDVAAARRGSVHGSRGNAGLRKTSGVAQGTGTAKFDLSLTVSTRAEGPSAALEYSLDLFDRPTMLRLLDQLQRLLEAVAEGPERRISELAWLGEAASHQLLWEWNDTDLRLPELCLHELIEEQSERTPDAVAVATEEGFLSYGELDRRAERLARFLRGLGIRPEACVGICLEREPEMIATMLGVLRAGGAYLPLDPASPPGRLRFLLEDSRAKVLLSKEPLVATLPRFGLRTVLLDREVAGSAPEEMGPALRACPENPAYAMYTSGSTGPAKRVMIEHRAASWYARVAAVNYGIVPGDRVLQFASVSFDISVEEIFPCLSCGATLVLPRDEARLSAGSFLDCCAEQGVTVLSMATAFWHELCAAVGAGEVLPASLRLVCVGGEQVLAERVAVWRRIDPERELLNSYGPTETTVVASLHWIGREPDSREIPLGRPIPGARIHLLSSSREPLPVGITGELCISGTGLARGYAGHPDLTAERFVPDPFGEPGARLYRTGDRARRRADGAVEYLGRTDHQVKIRGFRVHPAEVESALGALPGVRANVVVVRQGAAGDRRLVAYVEGEVEKGSLRDRLRERLPDYMIPAFFVVLERLPLTPNGKVDRRALPEPELVEVESPGGLPRSGVEELLVSIWADVLDVSSVGLHDSFFVLGGHSLLAVRVTSRVRAMFGVELPVRALFEEPTVARLAQRIAGLLRSGTELAAPPIKRTAGTGAVPLSFAQQRLWFLDQLEPGRATYNIPTAVRFVGPLRPEALARSLTEVVRRHEVLRTVFAAVEGEPVQVIRPAAVLELPVVDLSGLVEERRTSEALELARAEASRPFDLSRGPLLRIGVVRLSAEEHVVLATMHHIVSDGWSMSILRREINLLYGAFSQGLASPLAELAVQYADYAVWQRRWLSGEVLEGELSYWRQRLSGAPAVLELPLDRPRPAVQSSRGGSRPLRLPESVAPELRALGRQEGATLFMTLLSAWQALLGRYTGQSDIVVGTPVAGRTRLEVEGLIGFFVNTLVLRGDLAGDPTFLELQRRSRERVLEAHTHQEVPFERLVEELAPQRSLSHPPLFQVMLALQNAPGEAAPGGGSLRMGSLELESGTAKFDLTLGLSETPAGLAGSLEYSTDLFEGSTVVRLLEHFAALLSGVVESPQSRLSNLPLLSTAERWQLMAEWNDTVSAYSRDELVHERFARWALTAERPAVICDGRTLSYRELDRAANRLAHRLRALGVRPEVRVGLLVERSLEMLVGLLAVLKAGGAYVPLDPASPRERLAWMLQDAGIALLLTQVRYLEVASEEGLPVICLDGEGLNEGNEAVPPPAAWPESPAYVIYTSGSTGRPKGVVVEHRQLANYVAGVIERLGLASCRSFAMVSTFAADLGNTVLFPALLAGGTLHPLSEDRATDPAAFAEYLGRHDVDCLKIVPSHLAALMAVENPGRALPRRCLVLGGETASRELIARIRNLAPVCAVFNHYGPTETTVGVLTCPLNELDAAGPGVPAIGRPLPGSRVYVVEGQGEITAAGVPGELYIGGAGLARGYLSRPDLTADRFVPDPFSPFAGARLYRTGDLARWRPGGVLEFLGRRDDQVKIRGFRIELGEVEAALRSHGAVREAVAVVREEAEAKRLVGYVVAEPGTSPAGSDLRAFLRERLPDAMVPAAVVWLESLPLTPNGKVDRRALPAPEEGPRPGEPPRGPLEEVVAAIWCEVLDRSEVGRETSFFDLGGHSLLAVRVASRVRAVFGVELPVRALFEEPTMATLAQRIAGLLHSGTELAAPPIERLERRGGLPLSFAQRRLWFLDKFEPGRSTYNIPTAMRFVGALDLRRLEGSLTEVVRRHESLRTVFAEVEGEPVQVIQAPAVVKLPVVDLSGLGEERRREEALELAGAEARRPFDLTRDPLLRIGVVRLSAEEHVVLSTMHHIVSDGWSRGIFRTEVAALYEALGSGRPSLLPELPVQYADYAVWQRRWLSGEVLERELSYWRRRLSGAPAVLELPVDRPRPAVQSPRGGSRALRLPEAVAQGLRSLGRREGATLFMTLLSAWQALLGRVTGQHDIVVGTPVAGRTRLEVEGLIGFFVNTLVLRGNLGKDPTFVELQRHNRERVLEAHAHQEVPFERLVEELAPQRSLSHTPLFQVMLVLQNTWVEAQPVSGDLQVHGVELGDGTAKFDLTLGLAETPAGLAGSLEYSADLFEGSTVVRMLEHFSTLLAGVVESPQSRLSLLPLLSAAERWQVVWEWSAGGGESFPSRCLHDGIRAQAERTPRATAVRCGGVALSYGELWERVSELAALLRGLRVGPEVPVGVCLQRTPGLVVGLLGVLEAGGFYVPLDPAYPRQRLEYILEDSRAAMLLTEAEVEGALPPWEAPRIHLDADGRVRGGAVGPMLRQGPAPGPENLAYLIYTSGSTGRPKAVGIRHGSAVARQVWAGCEFSAEELSNTLASTSISFDMSVFELFAPLAHGGTVVLARDALELADGEWAAGPVSLVDTVPSALAELVRQRALPASVRTVNLGGEALPRELVEAIYRLGTVERVNNLYGPSEDTTFSTVWEVKAGGGGVPIGRPLPGSRAYVLDGEGAVAPEGAPGELFLGGVGLSRGYVGHPERTAESFVPDPFGEPGARLYRTGDLARWRADGVLEYLGRRDHQVKIRGFRIELGEVEAALRAHPSVREAVAVAREEETGDRRLVGYVAAAPGSAPTGLQLRDFLRERLPEPMVPEAVVLLESLPLTPNGKVDRRALPAPEEGERASEPPRGPVEEVVAAIWCEVLDRAEVGRKESFFDLGGHSLLAVRVTSRLRAVLRVEVALQTLFASPTVAALSAAVERELRAGLPESLTIERVERPGPVPLSFAQQRLWFLDQLEPGRATYNIPTAVRFLGSLRLAALARSLTEVVRRHEVLRTVFTEVEGEPVQVIRPPTVVELPVVDLSGLVEERRTSEALELARAEAGRPFDLSRGPLLRVGVVRLSAEEHVVLSTMHHIVSDGWSMGILRREINALYGAFSRGLASPLPELPVQYADYAVWQRRWLSGEVLERELSYWRRRLRGAPAVLDLPLDRPRPAVQSPRGGSRSLCLPEAVMEELRALGRREGATLFMTLLSAWQALLGRVTGQSDIVVGTPVAGRTRLEVEGLIGCFVNTLVLRGNLGKDPTFVELQRHSRERVLEAHAHQEVPFERLVEELAPQRSLSHTPLFQVMLVLQNAPGDVVPVPGPLRMSSVDLDSGTAKFDLTLGLAETRAGLAGSLEYSAELFEGATIVRMLEHFSTLLAGMLESPQSRLSLMPLLSAAERWQMVSEWNAGGEESFPPRCLHDGVRAQAERTPEAPAVRCGDAVLSYGELWQRVSDLAGLLRGLGIGPEVPVGICLQRALGLVVGLLGVLEAGGFYVPLDPSYPRQRLDYILEDSRAAVLLTQPEVEGALPPWKSARIHLDEGGRVTGGAAGPVLRRGPAPGPENLAYLIYTSGSTGRPKAVGIRHGSAAARLVWAGREFSAEELSNVLASTSICFDLSVFELFAPLAHGGAVVLARDALELADAGGVAGPVSLVNTVPSALAELVHQRAIPASVRTVNLAGEALPRELVEAIYRLGTVERVNNLYGPSEDTTYSTVWEVKAGGGGVPIGRSLPGSRAYVLDGEGAVAPAGVPGELFLGGAGLARGYMGRPELTAKSFVPDPFGEPGARLYRTGDLARWRPDGALEFLGRRDHQVKIRGFRIELGEVEAALRAHPSVREAVVVAREEETGDRRLVGYVVAEPGSTPTGLQLREFLRHRLPEPMVPSAVVLLESLPLTPNGKVDRRALPAPEHLLSVSRGPLTPRDSVELTLCRIWRNLLPPQPIGVTDDFFDLGGSSLVAVRLLSRIETELGRRLPLTTLFRRATIEHLAVELRRERARLPETHLVEIQPLGSRPPLFFVHPVGGNVFCYAALARHLGTDQPFFGFRARGLESGEKPFDRLESMATAYVEELCARMPDGPCLLGGWSTGGLVAWEMARQLQERGRRTGLIAMLDTHPGLGRRKPGREDGDAALASFARDLGLVSGDLERAARDLGLMNEDEKLGRLLEAAMQCGLLPPDYELTQMHSLWQVFRANFRSARRYQAQPAALPVKLIRATAGEERHSPDGGLGWTALVSGELEVHPVVGDHFSIVREPVVQEVARQLTHWLTRASGPAPD
jgi:amino acid adenylation domain-containing protein